TFSLHGALPISWSLESVVGATGAVEFVERAHVVVGELEVEDLSVLLDALTVCGLRQHDDVGLARPGDQPLRRGPPHPPGPPSHVRVCQMATGPERAVGLERHAAALAPVEETTPELERTELPLVDD